MRLRLLQVLALLALSCPFLAFGAHASVCVSIDEASHLLNKDICIAAHVYDVVQLPDGTRFLDTCDPRVPDAQCGFTIVSLWEDRDRVGELRPYRHADIRIRGIVQALHGRTGMYLSHVRQLRGGPPRFRPNPRLAHGFHGEADKPPILDPNLRPHGRARAFMNSRDQELRLGR